MLWTKWNLLWTSPNRHLYFSKTFTNQLIFFVFLRNGLLQYFIHFDSTFVWPITWTIKYMWVYWNTSHRTLNIYINVIQNSPQCEITQMMLERRLNTKYSFISNICSDCKFFSSVWKKKFLTSQIFHVTFCLPINSNSIPYSWLWFDLSDFLTV